jgi:putative toxin-antitoxin system antitoxin component (TIGR02293 family)
MVYVRNVITSGIKRSAFDRLKLVTHATNQELADVVRIPARTLARREVFHPDESERILRVASTFQRVIEVFEDLNKSRQWFLKPKTALGGNTPLQFCDTEVGADEVNNLLGRIEQGVFS